MNALSALMRLARRGFARAGSSPLASGSWEALRAILVATLWTVGLGIFGGLLNLALFVGSLPEIVMIAKGGADTIQGGGIFAILFRLVVLLSFVFTSSLALFVSVVYLALFPLLWGWVGLRQGWSISLRRWEAAVRRHVRELAEHALRSAPVEIIEGWHRTSRAMGDVLGRMIRVRERSGIFARWLSRRPAAFATQLRILLQEMPGQESIGAAEQSLEDFAKRIRFRFPSAVAWLLAANLLWFALIKIIR